MDAVKPPPLGDPFAVQRVQLVLFSEPILAAATVYPKGYLRKKVLEIFGVLGRAFALRATAPLPPIVMYIAVTPTDLRLFGRSGWRTPPFEIGRWNRLTYRASVPDGGPFLKVDLDLERLGRIRLVAGLRITRHSVEPVFQLIAQGAAGPVM